MMWRENLKEAFLCHHRLESLAFPFEYFNRPLVTTDKAIGSLKPSVECPNTAKFVSMSSARKNIVRLMGSIISRKDNVLVEMIGDTK